MPWSLKLKADQAIASLCVTVVKIYRLTITIFKILIEKNIRYTYNKK